MSSPHDLNSVYKVDYVRDLPVLRYFEHTWEELALLAMFTKRAKFAFESEWRIIDEGLPPGAHQFTTAGITGVIFGAGTSGDQRREVVQWMEMASLDVPCYEATLRACVVDVEKIPAVRD
jgi:hypothetical protein